MKIKNLLLAVTAIIAFAMTVTAQTFPSYVPTNGLVGWWPFNGNANDESGNGNHGTVNGATLTADRFGNANKAYSFDGISNNISGNAATFPLGNSQRSISGWAFKTSLPTSLQADVIFLYGIPSSGGWFGPLNGNPSDLYTIGLSQCGVGNDFHVQQNYGLNTWYHYTITYNIDTVKIYINSQLFGTGIINPINTGSGNFCVGSSPGLDSYFGGKIDDIGIWNRALTQTEITALYSSSQNTINLNLTTFLEGSYSGNSSMTATLNKVNASISNSIADSIIVELHASTSPYANMYSSKGVVNTNGTAAISFPNSTLDSSYYIVIKHRNAIETWSAAPVTISNHTFYNFTTSASQAYGNNLSNMGDGVFGMYSGDINQDGSVDFNDYPDLDIASNLGVLGYDVNDLNGDASVDFNDYPILDVNSNDGVIAMRP
jgi:hypothetical protein